MAYGERYPPPPGTYSVPPPPPSFPPPPEPRDSRDWDRRGNDRYQDRRDSYGPDTYRPGGYRDDDRSRDQYDSYRGPRDGRNDDRQHQSVRYRERDSYMKQGPTPPSSNGYDSFRPPQSDFSFRAEKPPGVQDLPYDDYPSRNGGDPPRGPRDDRQRRDRPRDRPRGNDRRDGRNGNRNGPSQFKPYFFKAANRPMLREQPKNSNEINYADEERGVTYRAYIELSDSDEADMDISGSDGDEPSAKRARTAEMKAPAADSVPKWSNPDPYTALPPPDTSQSKKKDVVQLIRKSRVQAEQDKKTDIPEKAAEYISCDFSDDEEGFIDETKVETKLLPRKPASPPPKALEGRSRRVTRSMVATGTVDKAELKVRQDAITAAVDTFMHASRQPPRTQLSEAVAAIPQSRKRTRDGELKLPPVTKLKKVNRMKSAGYIELQWQAVKGEPACPWHIIDHSRSSTSAVALHKEIVDFYEHLKPRDFEERIRQGIVDDLNQKVSGWLRDATVYAFGSFRSGLYLPTADMDLVICSNDFIRRGIPKYNSKNNLYRFQNFLKVQKCAFDPNDIELITKAKVPLVKYVERDTGLKMDISFERMDGINAVKTFEMWKVQYPAMPILVTLIKLFLLMRGLHEPVNGGIGGFSVICLVVSMLQHNPHVESRNKAPGGYLGELLLEFFELYGNLFNYKDVAIQMNPPAYVSKIDGDLSVRLHNTDRLTIIDPNNPENDITGGASNTHEIVHVFSKAFDALRARMEEVAKKPELRGASVLEVILGGNYSHFQLQREHLLYIYENGKPPPLPVEKERHPQW